MKKPLLPVVLLAVALAPAAARAQERGQTGLAMGYPTNIGFIWHVSDTLALRPEVNFTHQTGQAESSVFGLGSLGKANSYTIATSALWYRGKFDNVRPYFAPRFTYGRASSESNSNATPVVSHAISVSGSFGAQYSPARRFSIYGEVGYGFNRSASEVNTPISRNKTTTRSWSPRSAVGVIFYFK